MKILPNPFLRVKCLLVNSSNVMTSVITSFPPWNSIDYGFCSRIHHSQLIFNRDKSSIHTWLGLGQRIYETGKGLTMNFSQLVFYIFLIQAFFPSLFLSHICLHDMDRYVDVSTVDGGTSKLISGHIKASGASFLEVKICSYCNYSCSN